MGKVKSSDKKPAAESNVASISPDVTEQDPSSSRRPRLPRRCAIDTPKEESSNNKMHAVGKRRSTIDVEQDRSSSISLPKKKKKVAAKKKEGTMNSEVIVVASAVEEKRGVDPQEDVVAEEKEASKNPANDVDASKVSPSPVDEITASNDDEKKRVVSSMPDRRKQGNGTSHDKTEKLTVYPMHDKRRTQSRGNIEFRKDCEAAKFVYLDAEASSEARAEVVETLFHRYRFAMDEVAARTKIVKAVSEKRGFYDKLTTEADRIKYAHLAQYHRQGSHPGRRARPLKEPPVPTESKHLHEFAKCSSYIEELAFHHYRDFTKDDDLDQLSPLPPPPSEIPRPPKHRSITWKYDAETRVYLGDFSSVEVIPEDQKIFLGSLMERDDITVICEGLYEKIINVKRFLFSLGLAFGKTPYPKFRQFMRRQSHETGLTHYEEVDGSIAMDVKEKYLNYLARNAYGGSDFKTCTFDLQTPLETKSVVEAVAVVSAASAMDANTAEETDSPDALDDISQAQDRTIYMTDVELPNRFPVFDKEYKKKFKMKEILPGGKWCLMSHLPDQAQPFMGPNLYISPGGGFTQMHQDGHGTVDSGHSSFSGYNEVVMLRRLPECHKRNACQLIPAESTDGTSRKQQAQNVLFRLPHDDGRNDKLSWPKLATIESWKQWGYCPSVFILKPGQHLIINKGRLHAFRKMTFDELPDDDCHAQLRKSMTHQLKSQNIHRPPLCISVAFDWSFAGISAEGINRELAATMESASWCRKFSTCKSLAVPETAILKIAETFPERENLLSPLPVLTGDSESREEYEPPCLDVLRGILPALQYIVERDLRAMKRKRALNCDLPDTFPETSHNSVDPFGNDYFCKICFQELSNTYFHCNGCERILVKDFNICIECYMEDSYEVNVEMNPGVKLPMASHYHHFGSPSIRCHHLSSKCQECVLCKKCSFGTCSCHKSFDMRCRFYAVEEQQAMLQRCKQVCEGNELKYAVETVFRLHGETMIPMQDDVDEGITDDGNGIVLTASNFEPRNLNVEDSNAVISESKEDMLQPSSSVEISNEGNGSGDVMELHGPAVISEIRGDPRECAKVVHDKLEGTDDVVEISPSKKLRTDNLANLCDADMLDVTDHELENQNESGDGTLTDDELENQKDVSFVLERRRQSGRSIRTDTLGLDFGSDKFVRDASVAFVATEELFTAV